MKHFKISGHVTFEFEKIVEYENIEKANDGDMNDWVDEVAVDDVEELEEE